MLGAPEKVAYNFKTLKIVYYFLKNFKEFLHSLYTMMVFKVIKKQQLKMSVDEPQNRQGPFKKVRGSTRGGGMKYSHNLMSPTK